jgi:hypothetical protein
MPLASAARCAALAWSRKCINAEERRSQSTEHLKLALTIIDRQVQ